MANYPEATAADLERAGTSVLVQVDTLNAMGHVVVSEAKQVPLAVLVEAIREKLKAEPTP